jgi:hypothetical protein
MLKITPNREVRKAIARAELTANLDPLETRLAAQKKITSSDIEALQGDVIEVDEPRCWDLAQVASLAGLSAESEIERQLADHEFLLMQFGLSIALAPEHLLDWARWMVKIETLDGGAVPSIHSLFPGRSLTNSGSIAVGRNFQFVPSDGGSQVLAEIEMPSQGGTSVTGIVMKQNRPSWDISDGASGYVITYAVVRKRRTDRLRAEFTFHARMKIKGGACAAAAQNWTMGGKTYVF